VFEGERCEAKQKQKLTREENGKERTLKHQQRGYPIFSELSHHLSRYRQASTTDKKEKIQTSRKHTLVSI
jgi:hypothetical protein